MLGNRHELDVREASLSHIFNKGLGELDVGEPGPPGADVDFVDAHRLAERVPLGPGRHPVLVGPLVFGFEYDRRGGWWSLGESGQRIGLAVPGSVVAADLVLVPDARADTGDEQLPDT